MKTLLAIATIALAGFLTAPRAEAGHSSPSPHTYRSGSASCGCPQYTTRYFRGYDNCRRPIYSYVRVAQRHGSSCRHNSHYQRPHTSGYGYRGIVPRITIQSRSYSRGYSAPPRGYSRGYSRSRYSSGQSCR